MTLMRAAFETPDSNVVLFTVLCKGCLKEIVDKRTTRHWTAPLRFPGGSCEFCLDEARQAI